MAQISYGTITITDTNDIESIIVEYARNQSTSSAPTSGWSTTRPTWAQGYYIWQRTRTHKAGTSTDSDIYGTAVCITGSTGQTGGTGAAGRSLTNTVTQYTTATNSATITQSNMGSYTWNSNVPSYSSSTPAYWVRVTNAYSNPSSTEYIIYKDNGLTDVITKSVEANSIAQHANENAQGAMAQAAEAQYQAEALDTKLKNFFWPGDDNYPGAYAVGKGSSDGLNVEDISTYGYNVRLTPATISIGYNEVSAILIDGSNPTLKFYPPSKTARNPNNPTMELTSSALKFYRPGTTTVDAELNSNGLKITNGSIVLGTTDGTAAGNITLSNTDFSRSINGTPRSNLRLAIGGNFGVKNDGTLYASNAEISGKIIVGSGSNLSAGLTAYSTTEQTQSYVTGLGYQTSSQVSSAITNGISNASVSDLSDGSSYSNTTEMNTAIGNATNDNIVSATTLYYASNSTTAPTKPASHITTNNTSKRREWNIVLPTYNTSDPYLYICTEYKTKNNTYSWTSVEQTSYSSAISAIKANADAAIKTQVNLYYASNSTTPPNKPTTHVSTNNSSSYGTWNIALPTYSATYPYLYTCKETLTNGGTYAWTSVEQSTYAAATAAIKTTAEAAAPKSTAIKRTQRIYYRTQSSTPPSTPGTATTNWVTNGNVDTESQPWEKYDHWSTRVPPMADDVNINSEGGATQYLYLWTCEQKEVVNATNPVSYTEVLLDESNAIIDGSHIITGSIAANKLNAGSINAWNQLSVGAFATDDRNNILNSRMLNVQTYQGNIISFENENNALIQKIATTIEPFQSGGGTPDINNERPIQGWNSIKITSAGKNLVYFPPLTNITHNGITYTLSDDNNSLTISGTASNNSQCYSTSINTNYDLMPLGIYPAGTYTVTSYGFVKDNTNDRIVFNAKYTDGTSVTGHDGDRISDEQIVTFTATQSFKAAIWCYILSGSTVNCTVTVQMERASELSDYEPYINNVYEVSLSNAGTVYGGTLDITTGALKVTKKLLTLDGSTVEGSNAITKFQYKGGNTHGDHYFVIVDDGYLFNATGARWVTQAEGTDAGMICNYGPFLNGSNQTALSYNSYIGDGGTSLRLYMCFPTNLNLNTLELANTWLMTHNLQFVYPLATPITYLLSPQQITTLLNTNNIWSNSGNITAQIAYGSNDMIQALNILNEADEITSKQITNFISADSSGIMIYDGRGGIKQQPSNVIEGTHNVLIDQNSIDIRTGTTIHASFGGEGLKLYLPGDQDDPIAQYGATTIIGQENSFHIEIDSQQLGFYDGKRIQDDDQERPAIAYIKQDKMFIEKSVVAQSLSVGRTQLEEDQLGNKGKGQWSWQVHEVNSNGKSLNNLSLKWMG